MRILTCCRSVTITSLTSFVVVVAIFPLYSQEQATRNPPSRKPLSLAFTKVSICDALRDPERFDGKPVEIHAKYSATWEGAWLSDSDCDDDLGELVQQGLENPYPAAQRQVARQFGIRDVIRDKAWQAFDDAAVRLYNGMELILPNGNVNKGKYDYIAADFAGVLLIKRRFRVRNGFGNGWGHLGMSRFLFVMRSVSNVSPHSL